MDSNKQSMFSIYNIAISQSLDCNLDCNLDYIKNNNDILTEFKNYYNCFDDEAIELIFEEIEKMSLKYSENHNIIWDRNFYKECLRIEKFFIVSREAREASDVDSVNDNENTKCNIKKINKACNYCKQSSKKTKRCSGCYIVRYCSYACQYQDWVICHKDNCLLLIPKESDNIDNLESEGEYESEDEIEVDINDIDSEDKNSLDTNSLNDID